jgi:hypothetical protein
MAKPKYNKVEDALEKGLHDLKVAELLREADRAQGKGKKASEDGELTPKQKMTIVEHDLRWMYKKDKEVYKRLKLKRQKVVDLLKLVNTPDAKLMKKDIEEIDRLREDVKNLKKSAFPSQEDEASLRDEIDRHIYKRHKINEKWLPMDTHSDWDRYSKGSRRKD